MRYPGRRSFFSCRGLLSWRPYGTRWRVATLGSAVGTPLAFAFVRSLGSAFGLFSKHSLTSSGHVLDPPAMARVLRRRTAPDFSAMVGGRVPVFCKNLLRKALAGESSSGGSLQRDPQCLMKRSDPRTFRRMAAPLLARSEEHT